MGPSSHPKVPVLHIFTIIEVDRSSDGFSFLRLEIMPKGNMMDFQFGYSGVLEKSLKD
jgi:hypothetical protein